jgi:myo-inositol-1(or 4)-monophosphatase
MKSGVTKLEESDRKVLLDIAIQAAKMGGDLLEKNNPKVLRDWDKDIKISADIEAHNLIVNYLKGETSFPVLSEEDKIHDFSEVLKWVVDPLDGSLNFLRGIPNYAVSIGLMDRGEPVLGVVYDICRKEIFSGIVGNGAYLNDEEILVSNTEERSKAVIMTGFPAGANFSTESITKYISFVQSFKKVRLIGSAALSLVYVAAGRADVYYEKGIRIWDVAGGIAIVKAAGGKCRVSLPDKEGKCEVFCSNSSLFS